MINRPIYHFHIRKTGGTTINYAFMNNNYWKLTDGENNLITTDDKTFIGWSRLLINTHQFDYAFSHVPFWNLKLKPETFKFTCFRDPCDRIISHFNMLKYWAGINYNHPCMKTEARWVRGNLDYFLDHLPLKYLLNQLYMFSSRFNIDVAVRNIRKLDFIMFTESMEDDLKQLEEITGWDLPLTYQKKYRHREHITKPQFDRLRKMMRLEYKLLKAIK